jgi:hypothetical protein
MPERLAGFAARHRTALRRSLWLVGGAGAGAAAVAAGPRLVEALPAPQERRERIDKYAQQLRVSARAYCGFSADCWMPYAGHTLATRAGSCCIQLPCMTERASPWRCSRLRLCRKTQSVR